MNFKDKLIELNACKSAITWVGDKTLTEAWEKCERGDWMLWLYSKLYPENIRELTLAKGHCSNTVRHLMKDERSIKAVDSAIAFGEGKITKEQLRLVAYAAASAASAAYAAYAASAAAYTAKTKNRKETADICRKYLKII